jgi:hypothetical protein
MTTAPTPAQLMAGFKSGFGEIIDLVTEASDKTGPWVTARIQKMPQKTQDEIHGRFNEAFNDGVKDAAAGQKFYENSLDFPALAQMTTQVADDIELADTINKLFTKTAPIKTIHEQYKKLSDSARKEIEKHLKTTVEKKGLQNALITVFGGMGILETSISESAQKGPTDEILRKIDLFANWYKADLRTLERVGEDGTPAEELLQQLCPCTRLLIEQKLLANRPGDVLESMWYDKSPPVKEIMLSILEDFRAKTPTESIMQDVKVENTGSIERALLAQYLDLPRHLAHEYIQRYPNCFYGELEAHVRTEACKNNPDLQPLVTSFMTFDDRVMRELTWVEQCMTNAMPSDFIALDKLSTYLKDSSSFKREEFLAIYSSFSPTFKRLYKDPLWKIKSTPEIASRHALNTACNMVEAEIKKLWLLSKQSMYTDGKMCSSLNFLKEVYPSLLKAASPTAKVEPAKTETPIKAETATEARILVLAKAYKSDLNTLELAQLYLKAESKDPEYEKQYLLDLFKGLSPFAQLLIELHLLQNHFHGYSDIDYEKLCSMTMEDTVRSSMEYSCNYYTATLDGLKKTMLEVLDAFHARRSRKEIIEELHFEWRNPPVGSYEKLLLNQYLSYPRNLADGLDKNLDSAQFDEHLLKAIREKTIPDTDEYFKSTQDSEKWYKKEYLPRYKAEAMTREDKNYRYQKLWVHTGQNFSRMDFLDQVLQLL